MSAEHKSNLTSEKQIVRDIYDAINRNDIPGALKSFDSQAKCIQFEGTASAVAYRGLEDVRTHFIQARATWAEGRCTPARLIASGDKVVALVDVRVKLKDRTDRSEGQVGDVFTFRDGKVTEMRTFAEQSEALAWAGVKA